MEYSIYDFYGNIGALFLVVSYLLLQLGKIKSETPLYSFLNMIAGLSVCVSLLNDFNLSAFIVEFVWAAISLYGLVAYYLRAKQLKS